MINKLNTAGKILSALLLLYWLATLTVYFPAGNDFRNAIRRHDPCREETTLDIQLGITYSNPAFCYHSTSLPVRILEVITDNLTLSIITIGVIYFIGLNRKHIKTKK